MNPILVLESSVSIGSDFAIPFPGSDPRPRHRDDDAENRIDATSKEKSDSVICGTYCIAASSGHDGQANVSGHGCIAAATGYGGRADAYGNSSVAAVTCEFSTLCVDGGATGIAACERFIWQETRGAIVLQRWHDGYKVLIGRVDRTVKVDRGMIVEEWA